MKKLLGVFCFFLSVSSAWALSSDNFPDSFSIKNTPKFKGSTQLVSDKKVIGSLIMAPHKLGTYYFYDAKHQHQITVALKEVSISSDMSTFDVYDSQKTMLGHLRMFMNRHSKQVLAFELFDADNKNPIISAKSNIFGTKHSVYLGDAPNIVRSYSTPALSELTRPLFTWSRDTEVRITDKSSIFSIVEPNLFAAVLAVYCSQRDLSVDADPFSAKSDSPKVLKTHSKPPKSPRLSVQHGAVSEHQLKMAADILNQRYSQVYDDTHLSEEEKIKQFVGFSQALIDSHTLTALEEKAVMQFINQRAPNL